jgi:hypothetical protein
MTILSQPDPSKTIACTLPVNEARGRLQTLQMLTGDNHDAVATENGRLRMRIKRGGNADLEADVMAWAQEEKDCCAFLGFTVDSEPEAVTIEIAAPLGAEPTLDAIEWIVRAAARRASAG